MELLNEVFELTHNDTKTNIKIPFEVPQNYTSLQIHFTYGPKFSRDQAAHEQVQEAIANYLFPASPALDFEVETYLPVENLVTLSLSKNGDYLGGHHNKMAQQKVMISNEAASVGFWPTAIEKAEWELQLNCHCAASNLLTARVRIEGIE